MLKGFKNIDRIGCGGTSLNCQPSGYEPDELPGFCVKQLLVLK